MDLDLTPDGDPKTRERITIPLPEGPIPLNPTAHHLLKDTDKMVRAVEGDETSGIEVTLTVTGRDGVTLQDLKWSAAGSTGDSITHLVNTLTMKAVKDLEESGAWPLPRSAEPPPTPRD